MKSITVNYDLCKCCGYCIRFCPQNVYTENMDNSPKVAAPDKCTGCFLCVKRCPDFAIRVEG